MFWIVFLFSQHPIRFSVNHRCVPLRLFAIPAIHSDLNLLPHSYLMHAAVIKLIALIGCRHVESVVGAQLRLAMIIKPVELCTYSVVAGIYGQAAKLILTNVAFVRWATTKQVSFWVWFWYQNVAFLLWQLLKMWKVNHHCGKNEMFCMLKPGWWNMCSRQAITSSLQNATLDIFILLLCFVCNRKLHIFIQWIWFEITCKKVN